MVQRKTPVTKKHWSLAIILALSVFVFIIMFSPLRRLIFRPKAEETPNRFTLQEIEGQTVADSEALDRLEKTTAEFQGKLLDSDTKKNDKGGAEKTPGDKDQAAAADAAGGGSGGSSSISRNLPSISGFGSDKFTGTATINYPISIPPVRGDLGLDLALSYSSRTVDDLRTNYLFPGFSGGDKCPGAQWCRGEQRINDSGVVGLGWTLGSTWKISKEPYVGNVYMLSGNGLNIRITYDPETKKYTTIPDNKVRIERLQGPTGRWKVTSLNGTVYIFGAADEYTAANEHSSEWHFGDDENATPYCGDDITGWYLTAVSDIDGNTAEFSYRQFFKEVDEEFYGDLHKYPPISKLDRCQNTKLVYPLSTKYNYSEEAGKYLSEIEFQYEPTLYDTPIKSQDGHQQGAEYLKVINLKSNDKIIGRYELGYTASFEKKDRPQNEWDSSGRRLLTKITRKGFEGKGEERPYTFCYRSLGNDSNPEVCDGTDTKPAQSGYTPNDIYLTKADNGYGGKVSYEYEKKNQIDRICGVTYPDKFNKPNEFQRECSDIDGSQAFMRFGHGNINLTGYYAVKKITADNGSDLKKITEYEYLGKSQGYAKEFKQIKPPQWGIVDVIGLEFLGYGKVRTTEYDSTRPAEARISETETYLTLESGNKPTGDGDFGSCVMPDPRHGTEKESSLSDSSGKVFAKSRTESIIFPAVGGGCDPKTENRGRYRTFAKASQSSTLSGDKWTKSRTETFYDFEAYPNEPSKKFGNPVKVVNYGDPDTAGDEQYSYTLYFQDKYNNPQSPRVMSYDSKNLHSLVTDTFQTETEYDNPLQVPEDKRLNWQHMEYDERLVDWGYQSGISGVKGNISSTTTIGFGISADKPQERFEITTKSDYDKYGMTVKSTSAAGYPSVTFYDDIYHLFPICQAQFKVKDPGEEQLKNHDKACDRNDRKDDKLVTKTIFSTSDLLARGLPDITEDANGSQAKVEYDEYGRTKASYATDANSGLPETTPSAQAEYFDSEPQALLRVKSRITTQDGDHWQTIDTLYDGFGQERQKISYNLKDKTGDYAVLSAAYPTALGQAVESYDGVPLRGDLSQPKEKPQLISKEKVKELGGRGTFSAGEFDILSRPLNVKAMQGGENGEYFTKSSSYRYDGYTTAVFASPFAPGIGVAPANESQTTVDGLGRTATATSFLCDAETGCTSQTGQAIVTRYFYNALGKPVQTMDARNKIVHKVTYNSLGMPLFNEDSDRGTVKIEYDNLGRVKRADDAAGYVTENEEWDGLERLLKTSVSSPNGSLYQRLVNEYDKDYLGKLTGASLTQGDSLTDSRSYQYDRAGRTLNIKEKINLNSGDSVFKSASTEERFEYSATGLPLKKEYVIDGQSVSRLKYEFDSQGKQISASTFELPRGNPEEELLGNVEYDYRGQVTSYILKNQKMQAAGNSLRVAASFDNLSRIAGTQFTKEGKDARSILSLSYKYNPASGSLLSYSYKSGDNKTYESNYAYDSLGRLKTVNGSDYTGSYTFDELNNLLVKNEQAREGENSLSNTTNNFSQRQKAVQKVTAGDVQGEMTGMQSGDVSFAVIQATLCDNPRYKDATGYTAEANGCPYHAPLSSVVDGRNIYYLYDKKGNVAKEIDDNKIPVREFIYNALDLPVETKIYGPDGKITASEVYIYGLDNRRVSRFDRMSKNGQMSIGIYEKYIEGKSTTETLMLPLGLATILKTRKDGGTWDYNYNLTNHIGSIVGILDGQGNFLPEFQNGANLLRYFAYGLEINPHPLNGLPRDATYTGQKKDSLTGLMYYNARYYNPRTGLFMQADSEDDGLNRYAYVGGNPIMRNDPSGKFLNIVVGALIGAGADVAGQIVGGMIQGKSFGEAVHNINLAEVGISAGVGALTSGLSAGSAFGTGLGASVARVAVTTSIEFVGNVATEAVQNNGNVNWTNVAVNTGFGLLGNIGADAVGKAMRPVTAKIGETAKPVIKKAEDFISHIPYPEAFAGSFLNFRYGSSTVEKLFGKLSQMTSKSQLGTLDNIGKLVHNEFPYERGLAETADRAENLTMMFCQRGGVCRHNTSLTTPLAQKAGIPSRQLVFGWEGGGAHTVTVSDVGSHGFRLEGGNYIITDGSMGEAWPMAQYFRRAGSKPSNMHYYSESSRRWVRWNPMD